MSLSCTQIFPAFRQKTPESSTIRSKNRMCSQSASQSGRQSVRQSVSNNFYSSYNIYKITPVQQHGLLNKKILITMHNSKVISEKIEVKVSDLSKV